MYVDVKFSKCCYKCKERYVGCHDRCERYQEAKKKHNEDKNKIREQKKYQSFMYGENKY